MKKPRTSPCLEPLFRIAAWLLCVVPAPYTVGRAAPTEVPAAGTPDVLETDRDFAQLALENGIRAAYDRYLAADAIVFRPLPVPAREWFALHEPASGALTWAPVVATTSCDESIAVTLGTWSYSAKDRATPDTGQYVTAWRRSNGSDWQIALDQSLSLASLPANLASGRGSCDGQPSVPDKLLAADRKLNAGLRELRTTAAAAIAVKAFTVGSVTGTSLADLALTHGEIIDRKAPRGAEPQVRAVYVRVWQRTGRVWRVVQDFTSPVTQ